MRRGRYEAVEEAAHPGPALPRLRLAGRVETRIAAVPDPNPARRGRQRVAVNVACDALEREYAYGRLSASAYAAGRAYQRALEAQRLGLGELRLERAGGVGDYGAAAARALDRAAAAVAMQDVARRAVGQWAELILRGVLGERLSLTQAAAAMGKGGKRGAAQVAREFSRRGRAGEG
jgi:hypothetical protein